MGVGCSSGIPDSSVQKKVPSFKVVLVGDVKVGKTSVFLRYCKNQFDYSYKPTEGAVIENVVKKLNVPEDAVVSLTVWDIPGHEDMDLRKAYYKNLDAAIVVVDMNDLSSIEMASSWKQDILNNATRTTMSRSLNDQGQEVVTIEETPVEDDSIPVLLLGNKYDLVEEQIERRKLDETVTSTSSNVSTRNSATDLTQITALSDTEQLWSSEDLNKNNNEVAESRENDEDNSFNTQKTSFEDKKEEWEKERQLMDDTSHIPEDKDQHEAVKLLYQTADEHNFISSVMVSARESDGSVHTAIQSFVRHLLERKYAAEKDAKLKKKKEKDIIKTVSKKPTKANEYQALEKVGLKEFDELFSKCNIAVKKAEDYTAYFDIALRKFKKACINAGVINSSNENKLSLEDCILELKASIGNGQQLIIEESEGFIELVIPDIETLKLTKPMTKTVNTFNTELAAISKAIILECPPMEDYLLRLDDKLSTQSEEAWNIMTEAGKNKQDVRYIVKTIENNRARILRARNQFSQATKDVESAKQKVTAALVW